MQLDPNGTEEEDLYSGSDGGSNQLAGEGGIKLDASAAKWPEYANRIERIDTYKKWPKPKIDVNELAEAGMFYKGEDDRTECYYCGITIKPWEIHDDPWIEHARFSQDCLFLHFHKGWAFVKAALEFYDLPTVGLQTQRASNIEPGYGTTESTVPVGQSFNEPTPPSKPKRNIRRIRSRLDMDPRRPSCSSLPRELVGPVIDSPLDEQSSIATPRRHTNYFAIPRSGPYGKKKMNKSKIQILLCTKCNKNEANVIFAPCGHMSLCDNCALDLHNCPKCHKHISNRLRVSITVDEL